ncbi:NAD(P)/FAD-dependent oxidoreductase [Alteromonas pelagimontana]|uniref:NAD(P)/FAD-dependent oxidoreductase n=1 Tax=Alteromonas pelagimontana TaxID=1858656 RepID=A0A6M4MGD3_9ALTE|nr:NAD(P)/FAD-dependent oxidoreductase [Alteromonas pelagimontana]QJR82244.1 NAD(P)/FAD-dependent oxidoreductase [Alteromonas pelagimontana]
MNFDVIIVGGSFAGLSAAMQLVRGRRHVLVIDAGMPRNRFAVASHGVFTLDGKTPTEIRRTALEQLNNYPTFTLRSGYVETAQKDAEGFVVITKAGDVFRCKKLILATGLQDTLPPIPGLSERWGKTVVHCPYCHGFELRDRPLGVVATSAMSVHQAAMIPEWGKTTFFTQGVYTPDDEQYTLLKKRDVAIETSPIIQVNGEGEAITSVTVQDGRELALEGLCIGPKINARNALVTALGCELEPSPLGDIVKVDGMKETSVAGIFAVGDMSAPMQNATFAIASGVMGGVAAHRSLIFG